MTSDNNKLIAKFRQVIGIAVSLGITVLLLYLAFAGVDFKKVIQNMSHISWFWVPILILSILTSHFLRAIRWKVILNSVKKDTSILNLFGALIVGYGINCAVPRLGEVSRAILVGKWEGLSKTSIFGTVIVERVIDTIVLVFALMISVVIYNGDLYKSFPWLKSTLYITMFLMAAVVLFIILIIKLKQRFSKIIINIVGRISNKLGAKLSVFFEMLTEGFASLKGFNNYLITIILTAAIMIIYAINSYIGFYVLYMNEIKPVTLGMGWILMSISALGVVIPTPGGTGSYHALAKSALVLLFGFGAEISAAYAIFNHAVTYVLFIVSAGILYYWLNYRFNRLNKKNEKQINFFENN